MKKNNFFRFLKYVQPYWKYVALAVIGGIVKFTVPLFVPQITKHLVDNVYLNNGLSVNQKLSELFLYAGGMILVFIFFWAPLTFIRHYYSGKAGHKSIFDLRCDLYYKILRMSATFFHKHKSGGIVSRLINDTTMAQDLVGNALTNVWMDGIALIVILFFMFQIDVSLSLFALMTFPAYIIIYKKFGRKLKESSLNVQRGIESMSGNLHEKISGFNIIRAFGQEENEEKNFDSESKSLFSKALRTIFLNSLNLALTGVLTSIAPLSVSLLGGYLVITGKISVGELIAIGLYLSPLYLPLQRFSELNTIFSNSMVALDRIFEIMDEHPEIHDSEDAVELNEIKGDVTFENVSFSYKKNHQILKNISFTIEAGKKAALVGLSGSGKTTIISLIPRFYDVDSGTVMIDSMNIRKIKIKSLRKLISMVLQDPVLFSGTIRENIMYGNPTASEEKIFEASRNANAYDFIMKLPKGFDTEVGEKGVFLSGGQKQRLTIARAFLKNPRILILDEATSNLDSDSERLIKDALDKLMIGRTTIIIAHRLSTIINSDKILVLHQGIISESGTHPELLSQNGIYNGLYERQFNFK